MTRTILIVVLILSFAVITAAPAYSDDALRKLGRGVCNAVTCPFEIPLQMSRTNQSDGPFAGVTYGFIKGVGMMTLRALVGVYETVTFPIPLPRHYKPILSDPEFFFEDMNW